MQAVVRTDGRLCGRGRCRERILPLHMASLSVTEMPSACEDHGNTVFIAGVDDFLIIA